MKRWTGILILTSIGLLTALPAQAQRGGQGFEGWMDRQQHAIQRGIDSGALTRREARSLRREQREIRRFGEQLRQDGYSPREGRRLMKEQLQRADWHIEDLLHNRARAYDRDDDRHPRWDQRDSHR